MEKLRIALINAPVAGKKFTREGRCQNDENTWLETFPPITLASIAACLKNRHEIKLIDCIGSNIGYERFFEIINEFKPDYSIITTSTPTIINDIDIARKIKEGTKSKIIMYGEHVTARYKFLIGKFPRIDFFILGEPETPITNIIGGKPKSKGVAFNGWDGGIWHEPDLDKLPMPSYDMLPPYYFPLTGERWMFVRSGRGCPGNCIYCVIPMISGRKTRYHSPEYMIKQLKLLAGNNVKVWMFYDDIATLDKERMEKICGMIIKEGLNKECKWFCTTRVDWFDSDIAKKMGEAGCKMISFGIESGSQAVLNINRKGITLEQAKKAIKAAKENRITTVGHFILGLPGSDEKALENTSEFARELKLNFAQFYVATPFPGSEFYRLAKKKKWFASKDWKNVEQAQSLVSYPNLSNKKIEYWRRKAYKDFYMRPYALYSLLSMMSAKQLIKLPLYALKFKNLVK